MNLTSSTHTLNGPVNLQMVLTPDGPVPLYLQIKYQIAYMITSGQLVGGDRLPPVRAVATRYAVNPGTVATAYGELQQEGLLTAGVGRGTFVATMSPTTPDSGVRNRLAARTIEASIERLRSLALSDSEIRYHLEGVLASGPRTCHAVLAAPTAAIGLKYAASLGRRLGASLRVHIVMFDEVERGSGHFSGLLQLCYFVLTFAGSVRRVEAALANYGSPSRVVGLTTELQPASVEALHRLPRDTRALLFTEERYAHQSLGLLLKHGGLPPAAIEMTTMEGDPDAPLTTDPDRLIFHTFGAKARLDELGVEQERRFQLEFDIVDHSLDELRAALFAG